MPVKLSDKRKKKTKNKKLKQKKKELRNAPIIK